MADQTFTVNSGFYDAVNEDRLYTADDMNKPYKRIVADGVFATPDGTASTDLQVRSAGSGMGIIVAPGEGLCGAKWFNNPADLAITVPNNTALNSRIDSVIMQVDKSIAVRAGSIVYRTGYPAASPNPPALVNNDDVSEYRLANVTVAPAATSIPDSVITDTRGSADCPWVTSLIQQVDTSTLWAQYQAAYAEQFEKFKDDYDAYTAAQRESWAEFLQTLTDDLTVTMDLVEMESKFTASGTTTTIPIGIVGFNSATDILEVFINGLYAKKGEKYELTADGKSITLTNAIAAGNSVYFHVMKSVIGADSESAVAMLQQIESKVDRLSAKIPDPPTANGTYTLVVTVSNGNVSYSWS